MTNNFFFCLNALLAFFIFPIGLQSAEKTAVPRRFSAHLDKHGMISAGIEGKKAIDSIMLVVGTKESGWKRLFSQNERTPEIIRTQNGNASDCQWGEQLENAGFDYSSHLSIQREKLDYELKYRVSRELYMGSILLDIVLNNKMVLGREYETSVKGTTKRGFLPASSSQDYRCLCMEMESIKIFTESGELQFTVKMEKSNTCRFNLIMRDKRARLEIIDQAPIIPEGHANTLSIQIALSAPPLEKTAKNPEIDAVKTTRPPQIDGKLDDDCWATAAKIGQFALNNGQGLPKNQTEAYLLHDEENLYIGFKCFESKMEKLKPGTKDDSSSIFQGDTVEIFLAPGSDPENYYHFAMNPAGARYDAKGTFGNADWSANWRGATRIDRDFWSAEAAIPFHALELKSKTANAWGLNLCREEYPHQEISCWSPTLGKFHNPSKFGTLSGLNLDFSRYWLTADVVSFGEQLLGNDVLAIKIRNQSGRERELQITADFAPFVSGQGCPSSKNIKIVPDEEKIESLPYQTSQKGKHQLTLALIDRETKRTCLEKQCNFVVGPPKPSLDMALDRNYYTTEKSVQVRARIIDPATMSALKDAKAKFILLKEDGHEPLAAKEFIPTAEKMEASFDARSLPAGKFRICCEIEGKNGKKLHSLTKAFAKVPAKNHEIKIDWNNNFLVNGEPFFPMGIYTVPEGNLAKIRDTGFNTVTYFFPKDIFTYWFSGRTKENKTMEDLEGEVLSYLDTAHAANLKVMFDLSLLWIRKSSDPVNVENIKKVKQAVLKFKDHPALLAWGILDEPSAKKLSDGSSVPVFLEKVWMQIKEIDPYHPVWILLDKPDDCLDYAAIGDFHQTDPYPVGNKPLSMVSDFIKQTMVSVENKKPVGAVLQAFGEPELSRRMPTPEELRCMSYLAMIQGAKAITYFIYTDVSPHLGENLAALKPFGITRQKPGWFLLADACPALWSAIEKITKESKVLTPLLSAPQPHRTSLQIQSDEPIYAVEKECPGKRCLFAANPLPREISVNVSSASKDFKKARILFENKTIDLSQGKFTDRLPAHGTRVYEMNSSASPKSVVAEEKIMPQDRPSSIRGFVRDFQTKKPIKEVIVISGGESVLTDKDGRFAMSLPDGRHQLRMIKEGYIRKTEAADVKFSATAAPFELECALSHFVDDLTTWKMVIPANLERLIRGFKAHDKGFSFLSDPAASVTGSDDGICEVKVRKGIMLTKTVNCTIDADTVLEVNVGGADHANWFLGVDLPTTSPFWAAELSILQSSTNKTGIFKYPLGKKMEDYRGIITNYQTKQGPVRFFLGIISNNMSGGSVKVGSLKIYGPSQEK
ncbi:MAG: sugar-binding protein [Verrucomicrobiae bacterium]|nr:sugar-binding protein [Verrucomicrobiae bacterium]